MLPSATEIVYALGLEEHLLAVTFECDEPASARVDKAVVVGGRDTSGMTPGEIDSYVRGRLAAGEDLYTLDAGALAAPRSRRDPDPGPLPGVRHPVRRRGRGAGASRMPRRRGFP